MSVAHYEALYSGKSVPWRELGAIGKAANVRSVCRHIPHQSVLEIGCGDGSLLRALAGFAESLSGLEIAHSAVATCSDLNVSHFDGSHIPQENKAQDLVILSHVVEHLENPRELLREAARVGRYIFVEVPLEDTLRLGRDFLPNAAGHINFYSRKTIRQLLQTCAMKIVGERLTNPSRDLYRFRNRAFAYYIKQAALAFPWLATSIWTYHYSLLARPSS